MIDYRKTPPQPYNDKKVPGNVWSFNRVRFLMDEYENHPTQKPLEILDKIIKQNEKIIEQNEKILNMKKELLEVHGVLAKLKVSLVIWLL